MNPEDRYPRLLIFVSFSMPMATLKQLNLQAQEVGGKLVFRGLIKSSFKATIPQLKELGSEVLIDPTLFRTYKVNQVPAFVLQERSPTFPGEAVRHDILYGNVSLPYALKQFTEKGETTPVRSEQK
jgi:type-F conjugative transfer system pilin assembly protein TrbC